MSSPSGSMYFRKDHARKFLAFGAGAKASTENSKWPAHYNFDIMRHVGKLGEIIWRDAHPVWRQVMTGLEEAKLIVTVQRPVVAAQKEIALEWPGPHALLKTRMAHFEAILSNTMDRRA